MSASFSRFQRNPAGIAQVLNSAEVRSAVFSAASRIAANVSTPDNPDRGVVVDSYQTRGMRTDRPAASVTVRDPLARRWEWQHGVLTRAASAAGFQVVGR